ncbi:MAG: ATP-binding protein [Bacteroidota bacterium]|jgi:predicted ATPase|nr:ATP-binding protein [Bacteroidota bacterium]
MITLIEALNYRCLRWISRPLSGFNVLVGPNASGKTTFLDVIGFLRDVSGEGLEHALLMRSTNPEDLLFRRQGDSFELAVEALIPEELRARTAVPEYSIARYEIAIGFDETLRQFEFKGEKFLIKENSQPTGQMRCDFPENVPSPGTIMTTKGGKGYKLVISKAPGGNDTFHDETRSRTDKRWIPAFKLGSQRSALGNLPADDSAFPVANWFREFLGAGVQQFVLNSLQIRKPSPPTKVKGFLPDGSNLPWVIDRLRNDSHEKYKAWIAHLRTALPDLEGISTIERPEDKHRYLVYEYSGGFAIPSWLVSDGTLRLTALTLPAYLPRIDGMYLVEEPENGIHPGAVAAVYDSLSSVYDAQVLLASHSPVVLNAARPSDILCFAKNDDGATDIVRGDEHPRLREWQGEVKLGTLLAAGVLG